MQTDSSVIHHELQSRVENHGGKMKIEVNKEQLELLKYAILWYECNDEKKRELSMS